MAASFERGRVAPVAGQNVGGDGAHFQPDEGRQQFVRPGHDAHAGRGKQNQRAEFSGIQILAFEVTGRAQDRKERHADDNQVDEQAERVGPEQPGIRGAGIQGQEIASRPGRVPRRAAKCAKSTPWRALGTIGARNMTSMPNPQSTSSGAIRYKS